VIISEIKEVLRHSELTLFPAIQIYTTLLSPYWKQIENIDIENWRMKIICCISMCRLQEAIMRAWLPLVEEKKLSTIYKLHGYFLHQY